MSSTNRGAERAPLDAYYTDAAVASACVATLGNLFGRRVWEPHAGAGAFVNALVATGAKVTASDINPDAPALGRAQPPCQFTADFLACKPEPDNRPEWVIGNPPFNDAERHVRHALAHASHGVAFLLRLAFLESAARTPFWQDHPPAAVYVFHKRPSFTGGKTDSCSYGWFVWKKNHPHAPMLGWI